MMQAQVADHECSLLLDEYKLYVEMQDKISSRREETNRFYVTLLSALLALLTLVAGSGTGPAFQGIQWAMIPAAAFLGMAICALWFGTIRSFRQLNKAKFLVINEMEQSLPYACYKREWELMKGRAKERKYLTPTQVVEAVPILFIIPYLFLLVWSIWPLLPK